MRSAPTQLCGDRDVACGGSSRRAESSSIAARTFDTGPCERKNWNYRRDRDRSERSTHPSPGTESSGIDHPRSRSPEGWQTLFFDGAAAALASRQRLATALPMPGYTDPVDLAARLIRCPSVTPARGEVFDVLEQALKPLGFDVHRWTMGEPPTARPRIWSRSEDRARRTSALPATSTSSRRAKAGAATRSTRGSRTACWSAAAPTT